MRHFLAFALLSTSLAAAENRPPVSQFTGEWSGAARSRMNFTPDSRLPVRLLIAPDGTVSGTIGDARIVNGRIRERSWTEPRAMNHFEYKVEFDLDGPLWKKAQIARAGGRINLDLDGGELKGWFVSSGPKMAGRSSMQISAGELVLKRGEK